MNKFSDTMFFKLGAMKFSERFEHLTQLTDVCTYDATMYVNNEPKHCMIRRQETTFRPHLVRHLNLLDDDMRTYIQTMWNHSNRYVTELNVNPYQCFLVISSNGYSVPDHTHGDHMGDTITVVSTYGDEPTDTYLHLGDNPRLKYPEPSDGYHAVCFDGNILHRTDSHDKNYYFHFVYDLTAKVDFTKNIWCRL